MRHCEHCGAPLVRREGEENRGWQRRRFCNKTCSGFARGARVSAEAAARRSAQTKECSRCGQTFARRQGISPKRWAAAAYCSRACSNAATGEKLSKQTWTIAGTGYVTPCWLWDGARHPHGYGKASLKGSTVLAHRMVYERMRGPIPEGMHLDHLCEVRHCVNPDHLEQVTGSENTARSWRRGRHNAKFSKTGTRPVPRGRSRTEGTQ